MSNNTTSCTIIPALPGWYVAMLVEDDNHQLNCLELHPIIAWAVEPFASRRKDEFGHIVMPLAAWGDMDSIPNEWAIKTPEGKFTKPASIDWNTEAEAITGLRELFIIREQAKARALATKSRSRTMT